MTYVDLTLVPVARDRRAAYVDLARRMAEVYRDQGATRVTDYWQADGPVRQGDFHADGLDYAEGVLRDLAALVGASADEVVAVSLTEWPSREDRDRGTAAAARDPRVAATVDEEPVFDGSRLVGASFSTTVDLRG